MKYRCTILRCDPAEWHCAAADLIASLMHSTLYTQHYCTVALSGGSTPEPVYRELARMNMPWDRVRFFLADERCVSPQDADSNERLIRSCMQNSEPVSLLTPQYHPDPEETAKDYALSLQALLEGSPANMAVCGMGEDGHIASLFPPLTSVMWGPQYAVHTTTDQFAVHDRVSVTLAVLQQCTEVVLLLRGAHKWQVWEDMMSDDADASRWPFKALLESSNVSVVVDV